MFVHENIFSEGIIDLTNSKGSFNQNIKKQYLPIFGMLFLDDTLQ